MPVDKRIAFAGTRGLPADYGGFETAVDEITRRFVRAGYRCDVFCRRSHAKNMPADHQGRRLIYVRGTSDRRLETVVSALQTGWYLLRHRRQYDHVFWFNNANLPGILLCLLGGLRITVNTDGLEWRRRKWAPPFKAYYILSSWLISRLAPRLIADSVGVQAYYRSVFHSRSFYIPYGIPAPVHVPKDRRADVLRRVGVQAGKFFLQITRIEPDNLPYEIARGFSESGLAGQGFTLLVVGFREETPYARRLKKISAQHSEIVVLDAVYDADVLSVLRSSCFAYVHGNSVGGTNPALLEAMSECPRILACDVVFNREVLDNAGLYFRPDNLPAILHRAIQQPDQRDVFKNRIFWYDWNLVADSYRDIVEQKTPCYATRRNKAGNINETNIMNG